MAQQADTDRLLTIREAADILSVSAKFVRRDLIDTGLMRVVTLGSSTKADRIHPSDLKEFIEKKRVIKCSTSAGKSGGSNSRARAQSLPDPLGQPAKERQRKSSAS